MGDGRKAILLACLVLSGFRLKGNFTDVIFHAAVSNMLLGSGRGSGLVTTQD